MTEACKEGGKFVLNCSWQTAEECEKNIPPRILKDLSLRKIRFWTIDANKIAKAVGMAKRTNTVM